MYSNPRIGKFDLLLPIIKEAHAEWHYRQGQVGNRNTAAVLSSNDLNVYILSKQDKQVLRTFIFFVIVLFSHF